MSEGRGQLKCDGTRAETRFRPSAKRMSPFKSAGASVQLTTCSWGVHISSSNAGYIMLRGCVKGTGCLLHSPVSPSLPLPCVTVCHHISTEVYHPLRAHCTVSSEEVNKVNRTIPQVSHSTYSLLSNLSVPSGKNISATSHFIITQSVISDPYIFGCV